MFQGLGSQTVGGVGGKVLTVRSIADGPEEGTLRWAVSQKGPRIVQFSVEGEIRLKSALVIENPNITIDGSVGLTKASKGITVTGYPIEITTDNVILRYLRVRLGDTEILRRNKKDGVKRPEGSKDLDCVNIDRASNVVLDHLSLAWSADELVSIMRSKGVTVQWCLLAEPLGNPALHPYGDKHAFCANNSASTVTYHHNIFYGFVMRGPQFETSDIAKGAVNVQLEAINNLIYGYEKSGSRYRSDFADMRPKAPVTFGFQFIANYYECPLKSSAVEIEIDGEKAEPRVKVFVDGNVGPSGEGLDVVFHDRKPVAGEHMTQIVKAKLWDSGVEIKSAHLAKDLVLQESGCVHPFIARDRHDVRVVEAIAKKKIPSIWKSQVGL